MEFTKNKIIEIAKDVIEVESNALKTIIFSNYID